MRRIAALLSRPPLGYREEAIPNDREHVRVVPIWATRLQAALYSRSA